MHRERDKYLEEIICDYYEYFYKKLTSNIFYIFYPTNQHKKIIKNFILLHEKSGISKFSITEDYLFNFLTLQFEYFKDKYTRLGKNKVQFSWIIGSEAYKRWINKSKDWKWWIDNNLLKIYNIRKEDLIQYKIKKFKEYNYSEIKKQHNLGLCLLETLLYSNCNECKSCEEKIDCIELLKNKYPGKYKNEEGSIKAIFEEETRTKQ
jgi:hypothetical protein